jgi:Fic family protein
MEIPLKYELTREMVDLISKIEVKKTNLDNLQLPNSLVTSLQRQSLLKSSLFSAKIEGNTLNMKDLRYSMEFNSNYKQRLEIENILLAFLFIAKNKHKDIDMDYVQALHATVMKGLSDDLGKVRNKVSAIFNESGFPVYISPPPLELTELLKKLIFYITEKTNEHILIKASLSHISFEKIHPFLDGNGRVGRLLFQAILQREGYGFNRLLSIEELLNDRKDEYYAYLDKNDATSFIEFMLKITNDKAKEIIDEASVKKQLPSNLLLPRRKEILDVIKDHGIMSLDSIRRRFLKVSPRMIRYDLKKLEEQGYIIKLGTTRGAMYKVK